ncbi:hypothetical protein EI94DRAFT_724893 [Lactarius quietus]|nr:hypothetical protein EI94DRAFT_724893 [Lactarius quietus]
MPGSALVDLSTTFGATFIGLLVSTVLFGLSVAQTWIYFWRYQNRDSMALKFVILFVTVMDALHTFLSAYMNYWYLILNFGNLENLNISTWAIHALVVVSTVIASSVQLFYARRVYKVSQSIICPIVIVACVAVSFSFGIFYTYREILAKLLSNFHALTWISCTALSASAFADVLIAVSMCWYLYRKRTGFARTDSIIMSLMAYSINSGLLTSILGIGTTVSFAASPSSLLCVPFYWILSKCYVNSLLAMLNSRNHIRDRSTTDNPDNAYTLSSIRIEPLTDGYGRKSRQPGPSVSVTMHHSTTADFGGDRSDHDGEPTFDIQKSDVSQISKPSV